MDQSDDLHLANDCFLDRLHRASEADLVKATPCEGWDVADLLRHVISSGAMIEALVAGASREEAQATFAEPVEAEDLFAHCREAISRATAALEGPIAPDVVVPHPVGDVTIEQLMGFRIGDLTLHGWDLSRALGFSEALPERLVERVYADLEPLAAVIGSIGLFGAGPSGEVDEDADLETRLLDLSGRRP